jgi:Ras GTPase-activating-like protein IQGAP2/3
MSEQSTPPKGLPSSPSIFAYQTRLLQRTSSTSQNPSPHKSTPGSTSASGFSSLAAMAKGSSPPSTPIRRNVARMIANPPTEGVGLGIGMDKPATMGHSRGGRSMDLARGWEAKISKSNDAISNPSPTKGSVHIRQSGNGMPPPPLPTTTSSSSSFASERSSPLLASSSRGSIDTPSTPMSTTTSRIQKRTTVSGMDSFDPKIPDTSDTESTFRARPASISSYTSILSPHSTGDSSIASSRSQATEDRLAKAKANALKRREAKAAASGQSIDTVRAVETIKGISAPAGDVAEAVLTVKSIPTTPVKGSPFGNMFDKPTDDDNTPKPSVPSRSTPTSSRMSARNIFEQPASTPISSGLSSTKAKPIPSGLSLGLGQPSVPSGLAPAVSGDKYGSISKTDRRRLGRHLPRIASGGEGWEGDDTPVSGHPRVPSTLGRKAPESPKEKNIPPPSPVKSTYTSTSAPTRTRTEVLAPIKSANVPSSPISAPSTSTVSKRRSAYGGVVKPELPSHVGVNSPRPEVAGEEMKGLMSAVGAMSIRNAPKDSADGVTGQLAFL